jgi:hypothetical protein
MKIKTLGFWKSSTTWGGFVIAFCGASYALALGKLDLISACITFGGLIITAVGNLISMAQAKRQKEETEKDKNRLIEAEARIKELEPKLLAERIIHFMLPINKQFREMVESGTRSFLMRLNNYQYNQLEAFAKEDARVSVSHSTNTNVGPSGSIIEATLKIGNGVFPNK